MRVQLDTGKHGGDHAAQLHFAKWLVTNTIDAPLTLRYRRDGRFVWVSGDYANLYELLNVTGEKAKNYLTGKVAV